MAVIDPWGSLERNIIFGYSSDAYPEFASITFEVKEYSDVELKFKNRGIKDVKLAELKPILDRVEFEKIKSYNNVKKPPQYPHSKWLTGKLFSSSR